MAWWYAIDCPSNCTVCVPASFFAPAGPALVDVDGMVYAAWSMHVFDFGLWLMQFLGLVLFRHRVKLFPFECAAFRVLFVWSCNWLWLATCVPGTVTVCWLFLFHVYASMMTILCGIEYWSRLNE